MGYNSRTGALDWEQHVQVSKHFKKVLAKMLEMAVRDRYQSAQAVLDGLDMEAYEESLSQGLVKRAPTGNSGNLQNQQEDETNSKWASKVAESIRQRRTRMGLPTSRSRDRGHDGTTGEKSRASGSRKLTPQQVADQYKRGRRDFSQVDLYRLELEEANLKECIFREANLMQTNLRKGDLRGADFANGNLRRVTLREAKLCNAFFSNANLQKADLRRADLTLANFQGATLTEADLSGANLTNARISEQQLAQAKTNWATILPNGKRALW
jgi:serine/threonine-protein kinase